jgi:hypothetical protein
MGTNLSMGTRPSPPNGWDSSPAEAVVADRPTASAAVAVTAANRATILRADMRDLPREAMRKGGVVVALLDAMGGVGMREE